MSAPAAVPLLGRAIALIGGERVAACRTIWPDAAHFPERWAPSLVGTRRVLRRLLAWAGLGDRPIEVRFQARGQTRTPDMSGLKLQWSTVTEGAIVEFGGLTARGDGFVFFADDPEHEPPAHVTAVAAVAVAHAVIADTRARAGSPYREGASGSLHDDVTDELAEAAAVALGFGVLLLDQSRVVEVQGSFVAPAGNFFRTATTRRAATKLEPRALADLLALRMTAFDEAVVAGDALTRENREHLAAALAAMELPDGDDAAAAQLHRALSLPLAARWPPRAALPDAAFADSEEEVALERAAEREGSDAAMRSKARHRGMKVFRVIDDPMGGLRIFGLSAIGMTVGGVLLAKTHADLAVGAGIVVVFGAAGFVWSRLSRRDYCSEPDCTQLMPHEATICRGCGGTIAGRIKHARERLAARDDDVEPVAPVAPD